MAKDLDWWIFSWKNYCWALWGPRSAIFSSGDLHPMYYEKQWRKKQNKIHFGISKSAPTAGDREYCLFCQKTRFPPRDIFSRCKTPDKGQQSVTKRLPGLLENIENYITMQTKMISCIVIFFHVDFSIMILHPISVSPPFPKSCNWKSCCQGNKLTVKAGKRTSWQDCKITWSRALLPLVRNYSPLTHKDKV